MFRFAATYIRPARRAKKIFLDWGRHQVKRQHRINDDERDAKADFLGVDPFFKRSDPHVGVLQIAGFDFADDLVRIVDHGADDRQGDQADHIDRDTQGEGDHEQLDGLASDELNARIDAEARDQRQHEPSVVLHVGFAAGRLNDAQEREDEAGRPAEPADDGYVQRRPLRSRRWWWGQVVFETNPHAGFLVGTARRAQRHALGHAPAAVNAATRPGSCLGGRGTSLRRTVIFEKRRGVGSPGSDVRLTALGFPTAAADQR